VTLLCCSKIWWHINNINNVFSCRIEIKRHNCKIVTHKCYTIFEIINMSFKNLMCNIMSFKIKRHNITHVISWCCKILCWKNIRFWVCITFFYWTDIGESLRSRGFLVSINLSHGLFFTHLTICGPRGHCVSKARENGSENRFLSRVRSAAKRECEP